MRKAISLLTRVTGIISQLLRERNMRNNVILFFSLGYGVYFGFFIGLPFVLDISFILATAWLMILGFAVTFMVIKMMMVIFFELNEALHWTYILLKNSFHQKKSLQRPITLLGQ